MLVSPKWQTMWLESQHCSKSIATVPLSTIQSQKVLEDLRTHCCSSNKTVQLEALKCWGIWIANQNPDDWKLNTVCFTAVRPLITKKLHPLQKDLDICRLRLSLMWALIVKVQNVMQLEGPQYILEVFLQSSLTWLNSTNGDGCENEISTLIFQLLLVLFKKDEISTDWDVEKFPPLSTDIFLNSKKVFHRLADKFVNIFICWRKIQDKSPVLKLWKNFLELCELSCDQIQIPIWQKIFKLASQICSEKNEPIKERLALLHSCVTTLKSVLTSSKVIDFGNLLTTPCEAFLKKLIELCTVECDEFFDSEMFFHSKEICEVLSSKSVVISGYDLCISVLDVLEEFWLRSLLWGVWCGLVVCYKIHLSNKEKTFFTKTQVKFYRKLRGVAANFELDRNTLDKDCITEVEKHIKILNISCICSSVKKCAEDLINNEINKKEDSVIEKLKPFNCVSQEIVKLPPRFVLGRYSATTVHPKFKFKPRKTVNVNIDLIKDILKRVGVKPPQPLFNCLFDFRFFTLQATKFDSNNLKLQLNVRNYKKMGANFTNFIVSSPKRKALPPTSETTPKKNSGTPQKRNKKLNYETPEKSDDGVVETRKTRSQIKAEKESCKRKTRKSFEVLVQEIVRKNKERKTEKNNKKIKNKNKKNKKKTEKQVGDGVKPENIQHEVSERKLRNSKKADGKLENYFKVISKKPGAELKKEVIKPENKKKKKRKTNDCCELKDENEKKSETNWRQTSLKTMMNDKRKTEKVKTRFRNKTNVNVTIEKPKIEEDCPKVIGSPLAKLSPFKEVFHDHEYAKMEFKELESFEKILLAKQKTNETKKLSPLNLEKTEVSGETEDQKSPKKRQMDSNVSEESTPSVSEEIKEVTTEVQKEEKQLEVAGNELVDEIEDKVEESPKTIEPTPFLQSTILQDSSEDNIDSTADKRGKKRVKMLDSLKPSKKIKLEEESQDNLEVTEKENLEEPEIISPNKKDKIGASILNGSPKMISSRALRMIALVPESTKGTQMQWESPSRVEVLKSKKAPNVDKNSRASKMLALLSENVIEVEEIDDEKPEEVNSGKLASTPNTKTPVSSLKSPKSVRKRRSIRFDDAKNETVVYQTDTPPSDILKEKEKCRRIKPMEVILSSS